MSADVHDLAGPYAVSALSPLERARFERHLATCDACAAEAQELVETAGRLGAAVPTTPPASLRTRVLAEVDVTRQTRPALLAAPPVRRSRLLPAVAAGVLVVALGGAALLGRPDPQTLTAAVLAAPDAQVVPLSGEGGARGRVVAAPSAGATVLAVDSLPGGGGVLVLWTIRDGLPVNQRTLGTGTAVVVLEGADADQVAVTREPRPDVPAPTGPVVASAALD